MAKLSKAVSVSEEPNRGQNKDRAVFDRAMIALIMYVVRHLQPLCAGSWLSHAAGRYFVKTLTWVVFWRDAKEGEEEL